MKAIILAGGKGTRLQPYTTNFPKPLMPVGERPILEIVINRLRESNITDIIITTGYLEELIKAFFKDGSKFGVNIKYTQEDQPLGTAGPLNIIRDQLIDTFLLMNGDILCDINFNDLLDYHKRHRNTATVALTKRKVHIDFGVVTINQDYLFSSWQEKPTLEYMVSTGIYLFEPEALSSLPEKGFFNLPDFILAIQKDKKKVSGYVHKGYWLDIGRPEDYEKACRDINKLNLCLSK